MRLLKQIEGLPADHQVRVEMANYCNGVGQLMTVAELHEHVEACERDPEVAEMNSQFGGYVICDHAPLECRCVRCRRRRK